MSEIIKDLQESELAERSKRYQWESKCEALEKEAKQLRGEKEAAQWNLSNAHAELANARGSLKVMADILMSAGLISKPEPEIKYQNPPMTFANKEPWQ